MPIHDWTRVEAGIFHDFHHSWTKELKRALNRLLPEDYYALAEQCASGYGPDVLTLKTRGDNGATLSRVETPDDSSDSSEVLLASPQVIFLGETEMEHYHRKQKVIAVRHRSDDRVVAMIEVVSPGNKGSQYPFRSFVEKTTDLLSHRIHLLILDLLPPTPRVPKTFMRPSGKTSPLRRTSCRQTNL